MLNEITLCKDLLIGRTKDGDKYYLTINLRERTNGVSVDHKPLESYKELAFTGTLISKYGSITYDRGFISCGQNFALLREIVEPAKGFNRNAIKRIHELWKEWHLNDMNSHCAHQDSQVKWDQVEPCALTGYRAGSAWLVRELPDSVIGEAYAIAGKVLANA